MLKKIVTKTRTIFMLICMFLGCGIVILFLLILLLPLPTYKTCFLTLYDAEKFAKKIDESIKMESENTIKPEFSNYYKTQMMGWKKKIKQKSLGFLRMLHIKKNPAWDISFFKYQLTKIGQERIKKKFTSTTVCKINSSSSTKIVLFGNVQGAYHSIVRCLAKLNELNIIDRNLKIMNPDYFIIFSGNVIDRSPYTIETLSLVMQLLDKNPDNVLYLQGNHEVKNYWKEHTLKTELQTKAFHLDKATIPLEKEVNAFFDTLPVASYIILGQTNDCNNVIRISYASRDQKDLFNEDQYASFLNKKSDDKIIYQNAPEKIDDTLTSAINIKVIFKGEKKRESYQPHDGLRLLSPDMGATAWTLLSCPTVVYQKAINFVHDSFVIITPAHDPEEWTLAQYNRNVLKQEAFKETVFYLLSGSLVHSGKKQSSENQKDNNHKIIIQQKNELHGTSSTKESMVPASVLVDQLQKKTITTIKQTVDAIQEQAQALISAIADLAKTISTVTGKIDDDKVSISIKKETLLDSSVVTATEKKSLPAIGTSAFVPLTDIVTNQKSIESSEAIKTNGIVSPNPMSTSMEIQ